MIDVTNLTASSVDEDFLINIGKNVLKEEKETEKELSVVLVGSARIKKLNAKYRGKNRVTDILAFPEIEVGSFQQTQALGEIIICLREVKKNAKRFNCTFEAELARVLIHGILHLLGYDHEISKEKAREMEEKQQYYLLQFNL